MKRFALVLLVLGLDAPASAFPIIFDNIKPNGGLLFNSGDSQPSQLDNGFGFDAGFADDFILPTSSHPSGDWLITEIKWYGRFTTSQAVPIPSFMLTLWPDAGGQPAGGSDPGQPPNYAEALASLAVTATAIPSGGGPTSFEYTASLASPIAAADGTKYWLEIQASINYPPLWVMDLTMTSQVAQPRYGWTLIDTPFWTSLSADHDIAFVLSGDPLPEPSTIAMLLLGAAQLRRRSIGHNRPRLCSADQCLQSIARWTAAGPSTSHLL